MGVSGRVGNGSRDSQDEPRNFQPGENFLYNNSGFYLLAMVIERVTGQSHAAYLKHSLFEPLGLQSTSACDDARIVRHRAHGYIVTDGLLQNAPFISNSAPKGGGDLCSTAHDLVLWAHALASGRVVSHQSYALMTTPGTLTDGRHIAYGLGLFLSVIEGRPEVFHGGDFPGFTAFIAWYPADDVTIAVLQNSGAEPVYDGYLARRIVRRLLQLPDPRSPELAADEHELNRVIGTYRIGTASIEVGGQSSNAVLASDGVWQLAEHAFRYQGPGAFTSVRNPELRLQFGAGGDHAPILSLTHSGRAFGDATYQDIPK